MKFADRSDAGRRLAGKLVHLKERRPVVLALPRGGVAIGFEIAQSLSAPLDIVLVRKIGVPWQRELAVGAVTDGATPEIFIDRDLVTTLEIPESYLEEQTARELAEIERRREIYCPNRPTAELKGHTAIVVDDGIATGATMRVALRAMRCRGPSHLVVAVPVAPPDTLAELGETADEAVCLERSSLRKALPRPNSMTLRGEPGFQRRPSISTLRPRKKFSAPLRGPRSRRSLKLSKARLKLPVGRSPNSHRGSCRAQPE